MIERNARYSPWDGTQSMFELDAFDIMDELIDDLVYHGDVMGALRRLLQEGMDGREGNRVMGLQEILERMRRERDRISRSDALGGDFAELAQELRDVVDLERQAIQETIAAAGEAGSDRESELTRDNAEAALLELDFLPDDLAARVRALQNHQFRSTEAAQLFTELIDRLRAQLLEQTLESISESMQSASPEDIARLAQMLGALNQMIEADRAGEPYDFDGFMNEYGDFFPENPASLEELLEALAQRMVAMSSLLASMSPGQQRQLMELSEQLLADFDLNWQMSQLGHNLRDLFPDEAWDRIRNVEGVDPLQLGQALDSLRDIDDLDDLIRMLSGAPQPGALADVDLDRVRELVGEEAANSIDQLAQLANRLEREGLVERRDGQLELSARGLRRLGQSALAEVFRKLRKDLTGSHEVGLVGFGHERTYESKPFEWGDPFQVDLHRTLHEATRRRASMGETMSGRINLIPEDFVIEQTELSTRAATVLMLDLSLSMPMRDNFLPAKKVAIALHSLISSMYPRDYFGMVVFSESAEVIEPRRLPGVMWDYVYGTNMEHGFRLARQLLARESGEKQILMITDGEPTAHINEYGVPEFHYPPIRRTVDLTMTEVNRCTRAGIRINTFMLDADHGLVRFIEQLTELNGGRVFHVDRDNLGDFVLVDFVEHRSKRVRARR